MHFASPTDFSFLFMVTGYKGTATSILEEIICQEGDIVNISPQCISPYRREKDFLYTKVRFAICFYL